MSLTFEGLLKTATFLIKYPPTANHMKIPIILKTRGKDGKIRPTARLILAPKGKTYYNDVYEALHGKVKLNPPYDVLIEVHVPDLRKRDLANVEKACMDALDKADIIKDDSMINHFEMIRFEPLRPEGILVVRIEEVEDYVQRRADSIYTEFEDCD